MSNYCGNCRFDPKQSTGDEACPFTTLYWDFLAAHETRFEGNPRMALQVRNLRRKEDSDVVSIRKHAERLRSG